MRDSDLRSSYWLANLRILGVLLAIWLVVGLGLGVVFVEPLNEHHIAGFPLGFWFAQQGAIYVFMLLILVYAVMLDRLDARFRRAQDDRG